jgi:hypothetical protein
MDAVAPLAAQLIGVLSPFVPRLLGIAQGAVTGAADDVENNAWGLAKKIWQKLQPKVDARPTAQEAANDVGTNPGDEDSVAAFRKELRKLLAEDSDLTRELRQLIEEGERAGVVQVTAQGTKAVAIGGNASGAIIVSGDRNTLQR